MVYVDELFRAVSSDRQAFKVGSRNAHQWCHMWADTLGELHAMAAKIGLKREWFQDSRLPHYDLTPARRSAALRHGAEVMPAKTRAWISILL